MRWQRLVVGEVEVALLEKGAFNAHIVLQSLRSVPKKDCRLGRRSGPMLPQDWLRLGHPQVNAALDQGFDILPRVPRWRALFRKSGT